MLRLTLRERVGIEVERELDFYRGRSHQEDEAIDYAKTRGCL